MAHRTERHHVVLAAPMGRLGVVIHDDGLEDVSFLGQRARLKSPRTPLERRICRQLRMYFANPRVLFDIPLATGGTPFQQRVWRMLRKIPPGETCSYGELARRLRTSPRAVGNACRANPIPIVIPCHRVVAAGGIGGFMGERGGKAVRLKHWLLEHERTR